ncbi:MAG: DciA family protein [Steroidobacteraceae bacterium]
MPKGPTRNKNLRPLSPTPRPYGQRKPLIVKDLLAKAGITSKGIAQFTDQQGLWMARLRERLPPELCAHITGTGFRAGELTVYAESAAWSARLRYALADQLEALRQAEPTIGRIAVRLRPRASSEGPDSDR